MSNNTFERRLRRALQRRIEKSPPGNPQINNKETYNDPLKPRSLNEKKERNEEAQNQRYDPRDTTSERSVAESTRAIANLTGALVFVGIVSAFVSSLQWWEIHSGSADTHNLAEAAKNQSDTARDAYIAENRAFVGPSDASIQSLTIKSGVKAVISYKNTGREPVPLGIAWHVFVADAEQYLIDYPSYIANNRISCMIAENKQTVFVFPNSGFSQYSLIIDTNDEMAMPKIIADHDLIDGIKTILFTAA